MTYLALKYKKDLLGLNAFESAKINQWIEFANCEINRCQSEIIYPIFGWKEYDKEISNKENNILKDRLKLLENELQNKDYIIGKRITLADIVLFRYLRFLMMLHYPDGIRKNLMPNITRWFEKIMNSKEAIKAYGKTILCKVPVKPFTEKINKVDNNKEKDKSKGDKKQNLSHVQTASDCVFLLL